MRKNILYTRFFVLFSTSSVYDSSKNIYGVSMKKSIFTIICITAICVATAILTSACSAEKISTEKLRDIEFTVVPNKEVPEELKTMIDEKGENPFKLTYADNGELYIAVGYGKQPTSGYSINVKELYETENAIYIHTNLIGPAKDEKILERATYPHIAVKTEYIDKNVVFE